MYQVIKMYGDWEPWWFLDGWTNDIVSQKMFCTFESAANYYEKEWQKGCKNYNYYDSHQDFLTVFWNQDDERWCEECNEYLQQYHSLLLLKDGKPLPSQWHRKSLIKGNKRVLPQSCQRKD